MSEKLKIHVSDTVPADTAFLIAKDPDHDSYVAHDARTGLSRAACRRCDYTSAWLEGYEATVAAAVHGVKAVAIKAEGAAPK